MENAWIEMILVGSQNERRLGMSRTRSNDGHKCWAVSRVSYEASVKVTHLGVLTTSLRLVKGGYRHWDPWFLTLTRSSEEEIHSKERMHHVWTPKLINVRSVWQHHTKSPLSLVFYWRIPLFCHLSPVFRRNWRYMSTNTCRAWMGRVRTGNPLSIWTATNTSVLLLLRAQLLLTCSEWWFFFKVRAFCLFL